MSDLEEAIAAHLDAIESFVSGQLRKGSEPECERCHRIKAPIGRSVPLGFYMCDHECPGYRDEPLPDHLWPDETQAEYGYPKLDYSAAVRASLQDLLLAVVDEVADRALNQGHIMEFKLAIKELTK